jgi:hypothetical protein
MVIGKRDFMVSSNQKEWAAHKLSDRLTTSKLMLVAVGLAIARLAATFWEREPARSGI